MVLGSVLQAASGLGAGLVVVPLLSLIALDWVPGPCVAASLLLSGLMAYRGRGHWQRQHLGSMLLGLLAGIVLGGVLVAMLPLAILGVCRTWGRSQDRIPETCWSLERGDRW